jgi:hypothetical protein
LLLGCGSIAIPGQGQLFEGVPASPLLVPGCVGWYRGDLGISLNQASISQGSAFDDPAWTKTGCTVAPDVATDPFGGTTADSIIESAAGGFHNVFQTATSVVNGLDLMVSVFLKMGSRSWVAIGTNNEGAFFNASTGVFGTNFGTVLSTTATSAGNGWWFVQVKVTPSTAVVGVQLANADNTTNYVGNGSGNVLVNLFSLSQPKVSAWADQSGNGHNLTQGTATKQPLLVASALNGLPAVRLDGGDDFLGPAIFTLNQPCTYSLVYRSISLGASGAHDIVAGGSASGGLVFADNTPEFGLNSGASLIDAAAVASGAYAYVDCIYNGGASALRVAGAQVASGACGALNPAGFTLGALAAGSRPTNIEVAEVLIYSRVLSAAEQAALDAYRKARFAL